MKRLEEHRDQIDRVDEHILSLLGERFRVTDRIGEIKKEQELEAESENREEEQNKKLEDWAQENEVDPELVLRLYELIREKVKERHRSKKD